MSKFLKNAIIFGLLSFLSTFSSIVLAGSNNNDCNKARDYIGCMRFHSKDKDMENFSKIKESRLILIDKLRKCIVSSNTSEDMRACRIKPLNNN